MDLFLVYGTVSLHICLATIFLVDLISISQRPNKFQWALILFAIPFVSIWLYLKSRKRNKEHNA